MAPLAAWRAASSALSLVALAACAPDAPGPPALPRVRALAGDAQEARVADAGLTLVAATEDATSGRALPDVPLAWSTADGGRVDGDPRSDARGEARATWRLAPRVGTQTAVARAGADSVVFRARLLATAVRLAGDTLRLAESERARVAWQAVDAAGAPLDAPALRWSGADPAVATVTNDGTVVGVAAGVTTLAPDPADLAALGVRQPPPRVVVVVRGAALQGSVHLIDPDPAATPDPRGLRVWVRTATSADSADVQPDGRFAVRAAPAALRDSTEVVVDAAGPAARRWVPAIWRYAPGTAAPPLRFLLVPLRWRIAAGAFRGVEVAVAMNAALGAGIPDPAPGTRWYDRSWFFKHAAPLGGAPGAPASLEAFPDDAFPIPVYMDRERSRYPVAPADSVNLWRSLDAMHVALGTTLFRPAEQRALAGARHAIGVVIDSTLYDGLAASTWSTMCPQRAADPTCAGVVDRVDGTLYFSGRSGSIRNRDLVQHEAGHLLGLGHTCYWSSIMYGQLDFTSVVAPSCERFWLDGRWPSGFLTRADEVTARDAAYLALYLRVAATLRRIGPAHNLYAALLGDRELLLGLD